MEIVWRWKDYLRQIQFSQVRLTKSYLTNFHHTEIQFRHPLLPGSVSGWPQGCGRAFRSRLQCPLMLSHLQRKQTLHTSGVHLHFHHRIPLFHPGNGWSLRRRHYTGCSGQCSLRFLQCDIPAVPDSPLRLLQLPESRDKIKLQHRWCQFLFHVCGIMHRLRFSKQAF